MEFNIDLIGKTIEITVTNNGSYKSFDDARAEIIRRDSLLVIDEVIIVDNGLRSLIEHGLDKIKDGASFDEIYTKEIKEYSAQRQKEELLQNQAQLDEAQKEMEQAAKEREKDIEIAIKNHDWNNVPDDVIKKRTTNIILTTSMFVAKHVIDQELEVITAECAYGMNIFRDLFAGVRDIVGGRSKATEKVLQDGRDAAMSELRRKALLLGADAVIAIDLDYVELSGGGKSGILLVVATGTAVKISPNS